eukprot:IDg6092t1
MLRKGELCLGHVQSVAQTECARWDLRANASSKNG